MTGRNLRLVEEAPPDYCEASPLFFGEPPRDPTNREEKGWRVQPGETYKNVGAFEELKRILGSPFEPRSNEPLTLSEATLLPPRDYQPWVFEQLEQALADPIIKYIIIDSPTGTGKSVIGTAVARATGYGLVSAPTKYLQDQIEGDFGDKLVTVKGQSNYLCHQTLGRLTVEECDGEQCGSCVHQRLLAKSAEARVVSVNTALLLARLRNDQDLAKLSQRRVPVLDEAHRLEFDIINAAELNLTLSNLRDKKVIRYRDKIPDYEGLEPYLLWLTEEIEPSLSKLLENAGGLSKKNRSELRIVKNCIDLLVKTVEKLGPEVAHFQKTVDPNTGDVTELRVSPVNVSVFAQDLLFSRFNKFVLMSATFLDIDYFMSNLGIDPERTRVIKVPSLFPRENRPIYTHATVGRINHKNIQQLTPSILKRVADILRHHAKDKGIIATPSYALATTIFNGLDPKERSRVIYPTSASQQQAALEKHKNSSKPTILLSPSMTEGVNLKDDLSRLQILVRVPWPSLGDQLVVRRKELYPKSYVYAAILSIVQFLGRSVRSKEDKAVTYVLDDGVLSLVQSYPEFFPDWVKEALVSPRSNEWMFTPIKTQCT